MQLVSSLLANRSTNNEQSWMTECLDFLAEWYNEKSFIEVKTSGSTGVPKSLRLEKDFVLASAQRTIEFFQLKPGDRVLHCLPSNFIAGKLMLVRALLGDLNLQVCNPSSDFNFLKHEKYVFAALVPNQMAKILQVMPQVPIDKILLGGSAIPPMIEKQLWQQKSECYASYAMTETATHIALRKINGHGASTNYHCLNDISVCLDERDCLCIKMPGLQQGELVTNDIAQLLDSKTFNIIGRADSCIISGGKKYFPETIEQQLGVKISTPFCISAEPHEQLGSELIMLVEDVYSAERETQLKAICAELLSKHEQPRRMLFVSEIPRTANGKIKRT